MPNEYTAASLDASGAHAYFTAKMAFTTGPAELQRAIANDEVQVVDLRAAEHYAEGHIPGAISLPRPSWNDTSLLSREQPNVLVCYSPVCHLAPHAGMIFSEQGIPVMELEGGMREWRQHDGPIEA